MQSAPEPELSPQPNEGIKNYPEALGGENTVSNEWREIENLLKQVPNSMMARHGEKLLRQS